MKKTNLQDKIITYCKNNPFVILVWMLTVFCSSIITISQGTTEVWDFYERTFDTKNILYNELSHLSTNVDISYFNELLGKPRIIDLVENNQHSYIYINQYSYIQVIVDQSGKVLSYAVTSRVKDFTPIFHPPGYHDGNINLPSIILNKTTFYDLNPTIRQLDTNITDPVCYPMFGASRFNYFEGEYLGHPGNYQSFFVGINDAGIASFPKYFDLFEAGVAIGDPNVCSKIPKNIRQSPINTYIETAPFENIPWSTSSALMNDGFGVDEGEVRALNGNE